MLSVPIMALLDPRLAPVPQLLVVIPLALAMAWRERRDLDLTGVGWIIAGRVPGAAIGVALLVVATQTTLDVAIAVITLVGVTIIASGYHVPQTRATKFGAGALSGTTGLVASIGGPPIALLYSREEGPTVRATLASVFTIGLAISVTARAAAGLITRDDVVVALIIFPALVAGYLVSGTLKDRIRPHTLRRWILGLSTVAALALLVRAFA